MGRTHLNVGSTPFFPFVSRGVAKHTGFAGIASAKLAGGSMIINPVTSLMIELAYQFTILPNKPWIHSKPGEAYQALPESVKEELKNLKSDDIKDTGLSRELIG